MSLKIRLKPHEKILVGQAVINSGEKAVEFLIENRVPILREKDIMKEESADTPSKRLYFLVQLMYVDGENLLHYHDIYWQNAREIITAAPSTKTYIAEVSARLLAQDFYHALKAAKQLIDYEAKLVAKADKLLL
ncbi:MAG: flagellar biosynthesis repressor FlbT [Desulfuromonadaceae bacterium]|nr:flagellar biosynthesis repressor FlbT [Desulfuromonadaceae bacterium]MDD5104172.1 flagellar biosynthesis repressor FlbT [Desulfuromonadaceae bacterium]